MSDAGCAGRKCEKRVHQTEVTPTSLDAHSPGASRDYAA
jgi:hypothetical protein